MTLQVRHVDTSGLLDRTAPLDHALRLIESARGGNGAALLITGEPGIGKSTLLHAIEALARDQSMHVSRARGSDMERSLAFGIVRQIFASVLLAERGLDGGLKGAATLALPALTVTSDEPDGVDSFAVLHGLYWLAAEVATNTPLLITVDEAQWSDTPSLRFLAYLVRRLDDLPIVIVVAGTDDTSVGRDVLGGFAAEQRTHHVHLQPLGRSAARAIVTAYLGEEAEPRFVEECIEVTGGNPFLLHELMSELQARRVRPVNSYTGRPAAIAPPTVRDAVRRRMARLPQGAAKLASAAAILGDSADLACAADLADLPVTQASILADALSDAGLLEPRLGLTFVHGIVRSVVRGMIGPAESAAAHRRAAEILISAGYPNEDLTPHLLAGTPRGDQRVVEILTEQAERAIGCGAPDMAAQYLRRALAEPPDTAERPELLLQLGLAEMSAGAPQAVAHLRASAQESTTPLSRATACLALAKVSLLGGRTSEAVQACEQGLAVLDGTASELALELEAELFAATRHEVSARPTVSRTQMSPTDRAATGSRAESVLLANLAMAEAYRFGSRQRVIELAEAALASDWLFQPHAVLTLPTAVHSLALAGRLTQARDIWNEAAERYRTRGEVRGYALAATFRGHTALLLGDINAALADGRSGIDLAREHGLGVVETLAVAWLVQALTDSGDLDAAEKELAGHYEHRRESAPANNSLYSARGCLRVAQGRWESAVSDLRCCEAGLAAWGITNPWLSPYLTQLATALDHLGQHREAVDVARHSLSSAREWGAPGPMADALRVSGGIEGGLPGLELLHEAVAVASSGESPLDRARALLYLGALLRRSGRPRESREPLRAALDLASDGGAELIVRQANDELVASGAQPRRQRTTGVDAMTATERRVAVMVADGRTNRAVAQNLFVSEKTIETHLANSYRKLGISSRSQLPKALGTHRFEPGG